MQELFQLIGQLVRLHRTHPVKDGFVARKVSVYSDQSCKVVIVQPVELQPVEYQRRRVGRDLVLTVGHEFGAVAVGGALVIAQARERHDASGDHVDLFIALHCTQQARCIQISQFAFEALSKACAFLLPTTPYRG